MSCWGLLITDIIALLCQESLRNNETYRQISHMEEKLNDLMKDNKLLQRIVDELNEVKILSVFRWLQLKKFSCHSQEFDFSIVKKETTRKVDEYNKLLCADLKNQNSF